MEPFASKPALPTPPVTEPPYIDNGTTIYRSTRSMAIEPGLPTLNYTFRPPLGALSPLERHTESVAASKLIPSADIIHNTPDSDINGHGQRSTAATSSDMSGSVSNTDIRTCEGAEAVTLTTGSAQGGQNPESLAKKHILDLTVGVLEALTDVTPCGGLKTGPRSMAQPYSSPAPNASIISATQQGYSVQGSAPSLATPSITHTRPNPRHTALTSIELRRPSTFTNHPHLRRSTSVPTSTAALLLHLHFHHRESACIADPANQATLSAIALTSTMILTLLLSTHPSPSSSPDVASLPPASSLNTALLTIFSFCTLTTALSTNSTAAGPPPPPATTLLPQDIDNDNITNSTNNNIDDDEDPFHSLSPAAAAIIWAITAFAFLLAMAVLIWFCGVKLCWAKWRERRRREAREWEMRWWLR